MKKLLSILALVAIFATVTNAQSGPVMTLDKTEIDYGTITQGGEPLRLFTFKNTGDQPLIISNAVGSCGCTVPVWPKEAILPGESSKIEVRYDTNRVGPFQKNVTLTTNEATPSHSLTIKGTVNAKPTEEVKPAATNSGGGF